MSDVLSVHQLTKVYPAEAKGGVPFTAVDGISFQLHGGEILGLLGPNGAGKSTTIAMLLGVLSPTSGTITYGEQEFLSHKSEILKTVTFASTYIKMPWRLTVMENLRVYGFLYGLSHREFLTRAEKFLKFFDVWDQRDKTMNQLSAGQTTRVMLAKAFIPYPKIVLLDEPTASLDPDIAHEVRGFVLSQQREYNTSILYTSHNMDEVSEVCDRVVFLRHGKIIAVDTPARLAASVSMAHVRLLILKGMSKMTALAQQLQLESKREGNEIELAVDEHQIAHVLQRVAQEKIEYQQISIAKPTLEDYFLSQAGRKV